MKSRLEKRYRPNADYAEFRQLRDAAWEEFHAQQFPEELRRQVGERLAQHLESRFPITDMLVLDKYGQAEHRDKVSVSVYNPATERWDVHTSIEMFRKVLVPAWKGTLFCGGRRYSEEPDFGLNPETIAKIKAGEHDTFKSWEDYLEHHRKNESERVPRELETFFAKIVEARAAWQKEQRYSPERGADLRYPTWAEIAAMLPVAGPHIVRALGGGL